MLADDVRTERLEKLAAVSEANAPLDGSIGVFPILYADPPWRYEHAVSDSRAIENQYPTMTLEEICALRVADVCTPDAVLFLWATSPKLAESIRVLDAWGFNYRTCAVWVKEQLGMGYYFRQKHELLLVATRGAPPAPAPDARPASVVMAPRTKHSAKPPEFYDLIERMYPSLPKLELFCRSPRQGWKAWGNQAA
jgi:N6-adenosine-specific RNA methylase IME4